jgi:hypothetical protein
MANKCLRNVHGTVFHLWNPTAEQCVVKHSLVETLLSIMKNISLAEHNSYHYTATRSGLSLIKLPQAGVPLACTQELS